MITFVAGAALACELLATALVFLDTKRNRSNAERLDAVADHIRGLESTLRLGTEDAIVNSEKKLLEIKDELNKRDRYRLIYTALLVLALGIVLHAVEASREKRNVEHTPTINEAWVVPFMRGFEIPVGISLT
jgi:hypothetical protein